MTQSGLSRTKGTGRNRSQPVPTALNQSRLLPGLPAPPGWSATGRERKPQAETTAQTCLTAKLAQTNLALANIWGWIGMGSRVSRGGMGQRSPPRATQSHDGGAVGRCSTLARKSLENPLTAKMAHGKSAPTDWTGPGFPLRRIARMSKGGCPRPMSLEAVTPLPRFKWVSPNRLFQ